jgi:hypothetical protein
VYVIACISGAYFLIVQRPNIEESGMHSNGYNDLLSIHFLELEPFSVFKDMFQTCNTSFYVLWLMPAGGLISTNMNMQQEDSD